MSGKKTKKINSRDRFTEIILNSTKIAMYSIILFFGIANIVWSQNIPNVFFDFSRGKKEAIVEIFVRAANTRQMQVVLPEVEQTRAKYSFEVNQESVRRKTQIQKLMDLLQINPHSPEVLYSLHLLYQAEKNIYQSDLYLQQARLYDPHIGR